MKKVLFILIVLVIIGGFVIIVKKKPSTPYKPKVTLKDQGQTDETEPETVDYTKEETSPKKDIDHTTTEIAQEREKVFEYYYINNLRVNLRKGPYLSSEIIETLGIGTRLYVLNGNVKGGEVNSLKPGNWSKVIVGSKIGYVYNSCTSSINTNSKNYSPLIATLKSDAFVFSGNDINSKIKDTLKKDLKVLLTQRSTEKVYYKNVGSYYWYKMESCRVDGWVFGSEMEIANQ